MIDTVYTEIENADGARARVRLSDLPESWLGNDWWRGLHRAAVATLMQGGR